MAGNNIEVIQIDDDDDDEIEIIGVVEAPRAQPGIQIVQPPQQAQNIQPQQAAPGDQPQQADLGAHNAQPQQAVLVPQLQQAVPVAQQNAPGAQPPHQPQNAQPQQAAPHVHPQQPAPVGQPQQPAPVAQPQQADLGAHNAQPQQAVLAPQLQQAVPVAQQNAPVAQPPQQPQNAQPQQDAPHVQPQQPAPVGQPQQAVPGAQPQQQPLYPRPQQVVPNNRRRMEVRPGRQLHNFLYRPEQNVPYIPAGNRNKSECKKKPVVPLLEEFVGPLEKLPEVPYKDLPEHWLNAIKSCADEAFERSLGAFDPDTVNKPPPHDADVVFNPFRNLSDVQLARLRTPRALDSDIHFQMARAMMKAAEPLTNTDALLKSYVPPEEDLEPPPKPMYKDYATADEIFCKIMEVDPDIIHENIEKTIGNSNYTELIEELVCETFDRIKPPFNMPPYEFMSELIGPIAMEHCPPKALKKLHKLCNVLVDYYGECLFEWPDDEDLMSELKQASKQSKAPQLGPSRPKAVPSRKKQSEPKPGPSKIKIKQPEPQPGPSRISKTQSEPQSGPSRIQMQWEPQPGPSRTNKDLWEHQPGPSRRQ
ncbi:hypothetical protein L596_000842 [Steinernema carpocapsae]|uniref:Uncharacterized protein n=2 Tax=Steinernema carpocapsae TaxID=34508 RepID=A0A4U8UK24_STECR|nr:hypothetical protein L596_000842 [Steinernema carpocapsae]